jgi:excisionase family DNA binding protein
MDASYNAASTNHGETAMDDDAVSINLTIEEAARRLRIGRTLMYSLVTTGQIRSVTIGRLRRVPVQCLDEYLTQLLDKPTDLPIAA